MEVEPIFPNEDDEDTLSLSNLPINYDQNIEFWVEDRSTSSDTEQDFEFSSEMMIASNDSSNHIVFCGKIIHVSPQNDQKLYSKKHKNNYKHPEASITRNAHILTSKKKSKWHLCIFGFGSRNVPKKLHIEELRKRQTSLPRKCIDYSSCGAWDDNKMRSRGIIRFLGCGGGSNGINDDETPSEDHSHTWTSSSCFNK